LYSTSIEASDKVHTNPTTSAAQGPELEIGALSDRTLTHWAT